MQKIIIKLLFLSVLSVCSFNIYAKNISLSVTNNTGCTIVILNRIVPTGQTIPPRTQTTVVYPRSTDLMTLALSEPEGGPNKGFCSMLRDGDNIYTETDVIGKILCRSAGYNVRIDEDPDEDYKCKNDIITI